MHWKNVEVFINIISKVLRQRLIKWSIISVIFFIGIFMIKSLVLEYIYPWEVGVKQVKWGENKGFDETVYAGGESYALMPFRDKIHHFPINLQFLDIFFIRIDNRVVPGTGVEIPTTDGSKVKSDITIVWRIFKSSKYAQDGTLLHGGPLQLLRKAGTDPLNWRMLIKQTSEDRCKRALGSLKTDDYYNSPLREGKAALAVTMLNDGWTDESGIYHEGWHKYGVHVEAVLMRMYHYTEVINKAIAQKNLQVQQERLRTAEEKKAIYEALVAKVQAEGDALIATKKTEGESKVRVTLAQAALYERTKNSEGDLLMEKSKAEAKRLKAKALEQSGAHFFIAQQLSPLVQKLRGGIVSNINPFDIDGWIKLLMGKKIEKEENK